MWHHTWQWLETDDCVLRRPYLQKMLLFFSNACCNCSAVVVKCGVPELAAHTRKAWQDSLHPRERIFWQMATGFLQILSTQALPFDDPVKRLLSRTAVQYDLLQQVLN